MFLITMKLENVLVGTINSDANEKIQNKGVTLVPLKIYFTDGRAKVLLGICRGRKMYDKRNLIKERDLKREVEKNLKRY